MVRLWRESRIGFNRLMGVGTRRQRWGIERLRLQDEDIIPKMGCYGIMSLYVKTRPINGVCSSSEAPFMANNNAILNKYISLVLMSNKS